MGIYITIGAILIVAIFLISRNKKEEVESEDSFINTTEDQGLTPVVEVEKKVVKVEETIEQTKERLKSIINPDSDKPFAKISVPDVAETSSLDASTLSEMKTVQDKAPKVPRKPRAPKAPKTEEPKVEETGGDTVEPKAKRVYKKRSK